MQEEIRSYAGGPITNSVFDGNTIRTFGAHNEVVSINIVVDNNGPALPAVSVEFDRLNNGSYSLATTNSSAQNLFDWNNRPIEVFTVGYLPILGLSRIAYELYDETHVPEKMRRPFDNFQPAAPAVGRGVWEDRPHHNKSYPDIAEPQELRGSVPVASGESQSFWIDVYLPKNAPTGTLSGQVLVKVSAVVTQTIPIQIEVLGFELPDVPAAKTMVHFAGGEIAERYFTGINGGLVADAQDNSYRKIVDNHFKMAWRHSISMIDLNELVADKQLPPTNPMKTGPGA